MNKIHTINHVAFVIDSSGSMSSYQNKTREVFTNCIKSLRESSVRWNQETRVSVYVFGSTVKCVVFDMDVTRIDDSCYLFTGGNTALNDAVATAIEDSKLLPQKYGDHAFIVYAITDGEENWSRLKSVSALADETKRLGNYTWAVLVPNQLAVRHAKNFGYPSDCISTWDVSDAGLEDIGRQFTNNMETYYTLRSQGVRSASTLFSTNTANLSKSEVSANLTKLRNSQFKMLANVSNRAVFTKDLVEQNGLTYVNGTVHYQLVKTETIQPYKKIAIQSREDDVIYYGDQARTLLGLPNHEVKVKPGDHGKWNIFVQSTAPNRNIIPQQRALVLI